MGRSSTNVFLWELKRQPSGVEPANSTGILLGNSRPRSIFVINHLYNFYSLTKLHQENWQEGSPRKDSVFQRNAVPIKRKTHFKEIQMNETWTVITRQAGDNLREAVAGWGVDSATRLSIPEPQFLSVSNWEI